MLHNYTLIIDPQEAAGVANTLANTDLFALDLETTGLDVNRNTIHGISLATANQEWYLCLGAERAFIPMLKDLAHSRTVAIHNAPFDMKFLRRHYGVDLPNVVDTLVAQFLVDENQDLGLKDLAHTKLGVNDLPDFKDLMHLAKRLTNKPKLSDVNIYDMPLELVAEYAARDTRLGYDLWLRSAYELQQEGMLDHFNTIEMPFTRLLADMELNGFYINQTLLAELGDEFAILREQARDAFVKITGGVDPNSNQQVGRHFYETLGYPATLFTDTGAAKVDILALTRLVAYDTTGAVEALLTYRKYEKLIGTYVTSFSEKMWDGRLYGSFSQTGTVTGRLSSSSPNLQNIPSRGDLGHRIRELFASTPGYSFIDIDYSQLELRIAAHYTKDPTLIQVFEENLDPHQMTADRIGVDRYIGKVLNFSWFYGAGPRKLADTVEKDGKPRPSEVDTKEWLQGFERAYPTAARWKQRVIEYARELGYVRTIAGRKRRLPDLNSRDKAMRGLAERQAVNSIIQGSASDIIKWAMINIAPQAQEYGARWLAQVHDEICLEAPLDVSAEFAHLSSRVMVESGEHYDMRVALIAEPGTGESWGSAKG
jgi:DNA polymerase I